MLRSYRLAFLAFGLTFALSGHVQATPDQHAQEQPTGSLSEQSLGGENTEDWRPPISDQKAEPEKKTGVDENNAKQIPGSRFAAPLYVKASCEHGCGYSEDDKGWWQKLWTDPVAIFTAVLAVFTIFLSFATIRAANAAKVASNALPLLERAYVFFSDATCAEMLNAGFVLEDAARSVFTVNYSFKNHGRTPALISNVRVKAKYLATGLPKVDDLEEGAIPSVLVVGSDEDKGLHSLELPITGADFENAEAGNGRIFFWGILTYQDVFMREHETGICAEWSFGERRFVVSETKDLNYHT